MEHTFAFDLNRAIHDWRKGLAKSPALKRDSLDELEAHLKDSIATLMENELSEEEAFLIAVRRCGTELELYAEFSKSGLIDSLVEIWFFRTAWIVLGFLILLTGYSLWQGGAKVWGVYPPIFGLAIPNFMLAALAVTVLNTLQLRCLAKARVQNPGFSIIYWFVVFVFSGTSILAFNATFDILCGAFVSPEGPARYIVAPIFSRGKPLWIEGFSVAQTLILVLLLAVSGISACLRKIRAKSLVAFSS